MPSTNGAADNNRALEILIVGAGIGGLTAGIAFRQSGHNVTLLETSRFSNETGAAIHIAPNCNGLLRRLGLYLEDVGANPFEGMASFTPSGDLIHQIDHRKDHRWENEWLLVHRAHFHSALREKALDSKGPGKPCTLRLSSKVTHVNPSKPEVALESGEKLTADLVIGADGVHSQCRKTLEGGLGYVPYDCGHSGFRFLIPIEDLRNDPETEELIGHPGRLTMTFAEDRRMVWYPCVRNTLMNCIFIHPSHESRSNGDDWNQKGDKKRMLEIASVFAPKFRALAAKAPEDSLKVWTFLDLPVLSTWVNGNMALLGDAAHPFLPHQAQGGAQAIEDAISLATVLPLGTPVSDIPSRLQLYQEIRRPRANRIQAMTRLSGKSLAEQRAVGFTPFSFSNYNFSHDEYYNSRAALRKHLWAKDERRYRQTLSFGPSPGPRQPLNELPDMLDMSAQYQIVHSIRFLTSGTYLKTLFPTAQFSFKEADTLVQASMICCSLKNMVWLGDGGYEHCGLYVHGVQYTKKNGETLHGTFMPILFENLTDPIITGREELGAPKWGCNIEIEDDDAGKQKTINMSWRGAKFAQLEFGDLVDANDAASSNGTNAEAPSTARSKPTPDDGIMMYRYVPAVGEPEKADAEYAVFDPYPPKTKQGAAVTSNGASADEAGKLPNGDTADDKASIAWKPSLHFMAGDWKTLPTIHHVAAGLADMPIHEILEAKVETVKSVGDVRGARRIE